MESVKVFHELNSMQSKIHSLFQDLLNEKNQYQIQLEGMNKYIERLCNEVRDVKKENNILINGFRELKHICLEALKLFKNLDFSSANVIKEQNLKLEKLHSSFQNVSEQIENLHTSKPNIKVRSFLDEDLIKREIESISKLNFSTQFFNDDELNENVSKNNLIPNQGRSDLILGKLFERKPPTGKSETLPETIVQESEVSVLHNSNSASMSETLKPLDKNQSFPTPEKISIVSSGSPVFKDTRNKKQDNTSYEERESNVIKNSPGKLLNEKFLLKNMDFVSPVKRLSSEVESPPKKKSPKSKRFKTRSVLESPNKSPSSQLKKSNSREAEISVSGVRKLTQTVLNIECFKKRSPDKKIDRENVENENIEERVFDETKGLGDGDEDDVILESPKRAVQSLDDFVGNNRKTETIKNEVQFLTPPATSGAVDLDETYVSSSLVRNCKLAEKNALERIMEEQTPLKRPTREKSPEYDSVPFMYKREPVRKKAERMKLPGHTCPECNKYYKDVFGSNVDSQNLREVLNKCSRHRDKISPSAEDTPPGYWKPYLTSSTIVSPNKGDTALR